MVAISFGTPCVTENVIVAKFMCTSNLKNIAYPIESYPYE